MEDRRIISVVARLPKTTTDSVWQHSYGLILQISGIALPETFEAHFCNEGDKVTKTQYGTNGQVKIPAEYLATGKNIRCYIYMHDEASDGRTVRMITIPVEKRERPSADEPTPEEADTITQAIAAMLAAKAEMESLVADAHNAINEAAGDLKSQIPTKTSDLTNDSDYINTTDAQSAIDSAAASVRSDIPTKTSELTNDSNYINTTDGEAIRSQIPTKVSQLTNDKGFIESVIDE